MKLEAESPTVGLQSFPKASELTKVLLSEGENMATTWKMFISRSSKRQFCMMMIWGHFNRENSFTGGLRVSCCTLLSFKYQKQSSIQFLWNLNSGHLKPHAKNILFILFYFFIYFIIYLFSHSCCSFVFFLLFFFFFEGVSFTTSGWLLVATFSCWQPNLPVHMWINFFCCHGNSAGI